MTFKRDARDVAKYSGLTIALGAVALVVLLSLAAMFLFGFGLFSQKTALFRGETSKRNQVEANGGFRIGAYNHFFDLCSSVQAKEASVVNLQTELNDKANPPSANRRETINASITALRNSRAETIAQYNNDAQKDYTSGQFRDADLPYRLDQNQERTTCAI